MSKGFIFTMDAIMALIPIFVIIASLSGISYDPEHFISIPLEKIAGDSIEILLIGESPLLQQYIDDERSNSSQSVVFNALNGTMTYSYMLMYNSTYTTDWEFIAGRCDAGNQSGNVTASKGNASNVYVAERILYANNTRNDFRMYVWRE